MVTRETTAEILNFASLHEGEWQEVAPGERVRVQVSSAETMGAFSVVELIAESGNGVPMHVHGNEDEHFIVLEGALHIAVGTRRMDLVAGESITVGRGVPHAWCNASGAPVHLVVVFSPGGLEQLFNELPGADPAEIVEIAGSYGTRLIGPPLRETACAFTAPRR
jgi:mannose-6-phosphate isomerase-like protein (cupin superfamily)